MRQWMVMLLVLTMAGTARAQNASTVGIANGNGTLVVAGTSTPFVPRGFTSIAILYPSMYAKEMCSDMKSSEAKMLADAQARMIAEPEKQFAAMKDGWYANTIRLQVSQGALVYEHEKHLSAYTQMAAHAIDVARKAGLIVIVSMQTEGRGCTPMVAQDTLQKLPDTLTEEAWAQMLGAIKLDKRIVLEIFNEPDSRADCNHTVTGKAEESKRGPLHWSGWETGCGRGKNEGMLTLGKYVRSLAPDNLLIYDVDRNAESAEQAGDFKLPPNAAFAIHPYVFTDGPAGWDKRFGDTYAKGNTLITTEWNSGGTCASGKDSKETMARQLVLEYLSQRNVGMILFSWDAAANGELVDLKTFAPRDSSKKCAKGTGGALGMELFRKQSGK
jgi:hypothetical protein